MTIQGQVADVSPETGALPVEIAFLARRGVSAKVLRRAAAIAAATGVSADVALLRGDLVDETFFYRALAAELGLPFLADIEADARTRYPESIRAGMTPLAASQHPALAAAAPAGATLGHVLTSRRFHPGLVITTPSALARAVTQARGASVARRAAHELADADAASSFRDGATLAQTLCALAATAMLSASATLAPGPTLRLVSVLSGLVFFAMVILRLGAVREHVPVEPRRPPRRMRDRDLPPCTIIVALHREAAVLDRLVGALCRLDYPPQKLEILLVIEADDGEMRNALSTRRLPARFAVVTAPDGWPRTKPRALNVALPRARGEFCVIYDAEDVPDPGQLRLAVSTFAGAAPEVACLQARLVIDNTDDDWLTRFFTLEYAILFDVINPGLARMHLPVPLGGTSNHFRTAVLRELHGWDAWNVTEDADLGIRLALAGYRVADLPSSTLEEAPATFGAWMRQRSRWMKGFVQVCVTHSRHPVRALRRLGPFRFFGAVTMTFGTVAAALGYPVFMALSIGSLIEGTLLRATTWLDVASSAMGLILFVSGLLAMTVPAVAALSRRRWWDLLYLVPLLPLYYVLISIAAWRGLAEFVSDPLRWNKTEHGLARTSRAGLIRDGATIPRLPRPAAGRG